MLRAVRENLQNRHRRKRSRRTVTDGARARVHTCKWKAAFLCVRGQQPSRGFS